jgi:hypothetical protein
MTQGIVSVKASLGETAQHRSFYIPTVKQGTFLTINGATVIDIMVPDVTQEEVRLLESQLNDSTVNHSTWMSAPEFQRAARTAVGRALTLKQL